MRPQPVRNWTMKWAAPRECAKWPTVNTRPPLGAKKKSAKEKQHELTGNKEIKRKGTEC